VLKGFNTELAALRRHVQLGVDRIFTSGRLSEGIADRRGFRFIAAVDLDDVPYDSTARAEPSKFMNCGVSGQTLVIEWQSDGRGPLNEGGRAVALRHWAISFS
jgi:hypothetical protein